MDIDGGPELAIMEALARYPELSSLVDEILGIAQGLCRCKNFDGALGHLILFKGCIRVS